MQKHETGVCPGCSRHCTLNHVRCKFGQRYAQKHQAAQKSGETRAPCRWEKHVTQGGLAWQFLWTARRAKRALRKKKITEAQLLAALGSEEQKQLHALLDKIGKSIE